jgi:uncharacterized membrane protein
MNPSPTHERVRAIDWLRGIAVLFMIQCHALVLLRPELRQSHTTKLLLKLDGLVAPAFLFSAGFALAMLLVRSAAGGRRGDRFGRNLKRALQVLGVATLVNWMWFPLLRRGSAGRRAPARPLPVAHLLFQQPLHPLRAVDVGVPRAARAGGP